MAETCQLATIHSKRDIWWYPCWTLWMFTLGDKLRRALLVSAGLASAALTALGILIFLWGVDLAHPRPGVFQAGVLLCVGPILSAPAFALVLISQRWHRLLMWLLACASLAGAYLAMHVAVHRGTVWDALRQPIVIASIAIATLVEISCHVKRTPQRLPNRSGAPE